MHDMCGGQLMVCMLALDKGMADAVIPTLFAELRRQCS